MELKMPNPRSLGLKSPTHALACAPSSSPYDICTPSSVSLIHDLKSSFVIEQQSLYAPEGFRKAASTPQVLQSQGIVQRESGGSPSSLKLTPKSKTVEPLPEQEKPIQELMQEIKNLRAQLARSRASPSSSLSEKQVQHEGKNGVTSSFPPKPPRESRTEEMTALKMRLKELENENQTLKSEVDVLKTERQTLQKLLKAARLQLQQIKVDSLSKPTKVQEQPSMQVHRASPSAPQEVSSSRKSPSTISASAHTVQKTSSKDTTSKPATTKAFSSAFSNVKPRLQKAPTPKQVTTAPLKQQSVQSQSQSTKSARHPARSPNIGVTPSSASTTKRSKKPSVQEKSLESESSNCRIYVAREYYIDPATGEQIPAADFASIAHHFHPPPELMNALSEEGSTAYSKGPEKNVQRPSTQPPAEAVVPQTKNSSATYNKGKNSETF